MIFFVSLHKKLLQIKKMAEFNQYRQELRDKIIAYAMKEFYQRGVKAVKMDEISQGLHVSKRTVYEIFGDKEELLLAGMKQKKEESRQELDRYARTKAHNVIDIISYVYKIQLRRNEQVGVVFYEEIHKIPRVMEFLREHHDQEREESRRFFAVGVKEGLFRSDVDYDVLLEVGNVAMEEIMHRQLYRKYSMQQLFDHYILVVIRGFLTQRGLQELEKALA